MLLRFCDHHDRQMSLPTRRRSREHNLKPLYVCMDTAAARSIFVANMVFGLLSCWCLIIIMTDIMPPRVTRLINAVISPVLHCTNAGETALHCTVAKADRSRTHMPYYVERERERERERESSVRPAYRRHPYYQALPRQRLW